ncbi:MAG TPA: APC family permease [Kamptonema sp.]|nr:APC family permease [Kamptonema sp.]
MTIEMPNNQSPHGLRNDCLSYEAVIAQSILLLTPTAVPANVLSLVFASAGNGTWLSFIIGMVGLLFVSFNINQFACRSASPGSLYSYIIKGLGPHVGVLCAWALLLGYLFGAMAPLCAFAIFSQKLLGNIGFTTHTSILFILVIVAACYVAFKDIRSTKIFIVVQGVCLALVLLLCLIILVKKGFAIDWNQLSLQGATPGGVTMGLVLVVFCFSGFESPTALGDEAKNPLKTIPRAVTQSIIFCAIFYTITTYIVVLGFSGINENLGKIEAPLDFLAHQLGLDFLGLLISIAVLVSYFFAICGCINFTARIFLSMSLHGWFHHSLGKTHDTNLTPHNAIALSGFIILIIPSVFKVYGYDTFELQNYFGIICSFGFLVMYILVSIAAPVYLFQLNKLKPIDVLFAILAVIFMILPFIGTIGIPGSSLFPVPDFPQNILPYLVLMYFMAGFGWFLFQKKRYPKIVENMNNSIEEIHTRFSEQENL